MRISFHGAALGVTGSCHLLEACGKRILLDCGLYQGSRELRDENTRDFGFDPASIDVLQPEGLLVVISFHSLEDRIVKQFIAGHASEQYDRRAPFAPPKNLRLRARGRVKPSADEVRANPRARSAIMRIAQRTAL